MMKPESLSCTSSDRELRQLKRHLEESVNLIFLILFPSVIVVWVGGASNLGLVVYWFLGLVDNIISGEVF